jgi:hypothetical protein
MAQIASSLEDSLIAMTSCLDDGAPVTRVEDLQL